MGSDTPSFEEALKNKTDKQISLGLELREECKKYAENTPNWDVFMSDFYDYMVRSVSSATGVAIGENAGLALMALMVGFCEGAKHNIEGGVWKE